MGKARQAAGSELAAEHASLDGYLSSDFRPALELFERFSDRELAAIEQLVDSVSLGDSLARLAHGDFDLSHIYQQGGEYAGIIDFGEIRGAPLAYDLGHFALHDGEERDGSLVSLKLALATAYASAATPVWATEFWVISGSQRGSRLEMLASVGGAR